MENRPQVCRGDQQLRAVVFFLFFQRRGVQATGNSKTFQNRRFCISGTLFLFYEAFIFQSFFFVLHFCKNVDFI